MQLDFGFVRMEPPPRIMPARMPGRRADGDRQLEFLGLDRLQQHTFFFAVLVDGPSAAAVDALRADIAVRHGHAGRLGDASRLHLSLLCLSKQSARPLSVEAEQEAIAAARFVRQAPFELTVDRAMSFGRGTGKRPVVLTGKENDGVRALYGALFRVLQNAGIVGGRLQLFTPHITLFYDAASVDEAIAPLTYTVRSFHLIHSLHGKGQYRLVASFPLRA